MRFSNNAARAEAPNLEDIYYERVEELKARVPQATLYQAHPAFGLRRADHEWVEEYDLEDLDVAWLARGRDEQRRVREAFMSGLLGWTLQQGECRFHATLPDAQERTAVLSCNLATVASQEHGVEGQLGRAVIDRLVASRVTELYVYDERQPRVVLTGGWNGAGIWLVEEEMASVRPEIAVWEHVPELPARRRWGAQGFVWWRRHIAPLVVLIPILSLMGDDLFSLRTLGLIVAAVIVMNTVVRPIDRRIASRRYDTGT